MVAAVVPALFDGEALAGVADHLAAGLVELEGPAAVSAPGTGWEDLRIEPDPLGALGGVVEVVARHLLHELSAARRGALVLGVRVLRADAASTGAEQMAAPDLLGVPGGPLGLVEARVGGDGGDLQPRRVPVGGAHQQVERLVLGAAGIDENPGEREAGGQVDEHQEHPAAPVLAVVVAHVALEVAVDELLVGR